MSFFARLMALLSQALGAARNGLAGAYGWLHDAAAEAVQPFTSRAPAFRDAALAGAGYGAIAAGTALRAPGAILGGVGSVLRRVLPIGGQTAGAVANEAVARDNARGGGASPNPGAPVVDMAAQMTHSAAEELRQSGPSALKKYSPYVPPAVMEWLVGLDRRDLDVAIRLDPATLHRHANAERVAETTPLLPLPAHLKPDYVKTLYMSPDEIAAMKAQALRNLANSGREVAAMATRGPRPRPAPDQGWDGDGYDAPRPSMH